MPTPDSSDFDPERMIYIGKQESLNKVGFVDYTKAKNLLNLLGKGELTPLRNNSFPGKGKVPVFVSSAQNMEVVGCGCPPAWNELIVLMSVVSDEPGVDQVVPIFQLSDHEVRNFSMRTKFGSILEFGSVELNNKSMSVKNASGEMILYASSWRKIGTPKKDAPMNLKVSTIGGTFEGSVVTPTTYRIKSKSKVKQTFIIFDKFSVNKNSEVGKVLGYIDFKPLVWYRQTISGALAWKN